MDKAMTIMGIVVFVVILAVIIYLVGSFFGLFRLAVIHQRIQKRRRNADATQTRQSEQPVMVQKCIRNLQEAQSGYICLLFRSRSQIQPEPS